MISTAEAKIARGEIAATKASRFTIVKRKHKPLNNLKSVSGDGAPKQDRGSLLSIALSANDAKSSDDEEDEGEEKMATDETKLDETGEHELAFCPYMVKNMTEFSLRLKPKLFVPRVDTPFVGKEIFWCAKCDLLTHQLTLAVLVTILWIWQM